MKRHYGTAVPITLAEPVLHVFRSAPSDIHVTAPVWGKDSDDRHLIFEICISGITPGLYSGRTVRSVDLTRQARILELESGGMTHEEALSASLAESSENETDWRLDLNRRLTNERRSDIVRQWSYDLLESQIIMRQEAVRIFPGGIPDLEVPDELLQVDHAILDRWTAATLSGHPSGLRGAVREELRHVLQSPATRCGQRDAILRRSTDDGIRTTRLETVDTGPHLRVQRTVKNEDGILITFDGSDLVIHGEAARSMIDASVTIAPGTRLGDILDLADDDLTGRSVKGVDHSPPGPNIPFVTIRMEENTVTVSEAMPEEPLT